MEKALNILKDLCLVLTFNSYWKPRVNEAIAELEALQQPKRCDGCKFHDDVGWDDWCCDCIRKWTIDRYEPKLKEQ